MNQPQHGVAAGAKSGFRYDLELLDSERNVVAATTAFNKMPEEALSFVTGLVVGKGAPITNWYLALYENATNPTAELTAASAPSTLGECTAYVSATRPAIAFSDVVGGVASAVVEFTFTAPKTIRGGFVMPSSAKGGATGPILSAVRFPEDQEPKTGNVLRVTMSYAQQSIS